MKRFAQVVITYNTIRNGYSIENCEKVADGELPVTCHTCFSIWQDVHRFKPGDFDTESGKGNFTDTELTKITIGQEKRRMRVDVLITRLDMGKFFFGTY